MLDMLSAFKSRLMNGVLRPTENVRSVRLESVARLGCRLQALRV